VLGFGVLLIVANEVAIYLTDSRLNRLRDAAREAGLPGSLDEIAGPQVSDAENAAVPLAEASNFAKQMGMTIIGKIGGVDKYPLTTAAELAVVEEVVAKHPEYEAALLDVDRRGSYRSLVSIRPPLADLDSNSTQQQIRSIARIECSRAERLAAQGKREESVSLLLRMLRIARKREREPLITGFFIGLAIRGLAFHQLNRTLRAGPLSTQTHDAVDQELSRHENLRAILRYALATERVLKDEAYKETFPGLTFRTFRALANDDRAFLWNAIDWHVRNAESPPSARMESSQSAPKVYSERFQNPNDWFRHPGLRTFPPVESSREAADRTLARARCLRIINAIQRRQTKPTSLEELGLPAKTLEDPYSEKPLKWFWRPDGVVVYSVGSDLVDDGGIFDPVPTKSKTFDIGYGPLGTNSGDNQK
jgi:hypothetical protein